MSENAVVVPRSVLRLAKGAQRPRLVEPVLSARPSLVLLSAPSGYGKTVLAAQIAATGAFREVVWIRNLGSSDLLRDALAQLAEHLAHAQLASDVQSLPDICAVCSSELAALPGEHSLLVVIDDAAWAGDTEAVALLEEVLSDAPVGSTAVVTTRADVLASSRSTTAWKMTTSQLMLTDDEIAEVWRGHAQRAASSAQVSEIASASGRHAALVSLMARYAVLSEREPGTFAYAPSVSSLIQSLVVDQLGPEDRVLLEYAAVLGQGSEESLQCVSQIDEISDSLARIAGALPLVSASNEGRSRRFVVHDLVGEACHAVGSLFARDPEGLRRAVTELGVMGAASRGLEVAIQSGSCEIVAECLREQGLHLLKCSAWELVRDAVEHLPAEVVASDPTLMVISAGVAWEEGKKPDAIRRATLAVRLGELSGSDSVPPSARLMLAGMRMADADFQGAVSDLTPFLEPSALSDPDDLADALYAAIPALGFLGDRDGLNRCKSSARRLIAERRVGAHRMARLEMAMGVVADFLDGDCCSSMALLESAAYRLDVPQHWRARVLGNCAAAALECGDVDIAAATLADAESMQSTFSTPLDRLLPSLVAAVAEAMRSNGRDIRRVVERVIAACEAEEEPFTLATTCAIAAQCSLALGDTEYSRKLGERGIGASAATGSPILLWLAELVQAQSALAVGDIDHAASAARRILPQAESVRAMGHVLHARLILAEVSLRSGDFAQAIEHLASVSDHVARTSPALTLATYVRVFPDLLGALALALGIEALPSRFLALLKGPGGATALELSAVVLSPKEHDQLTRRMRAEDERVASQEEAHDAEAVCHVRLFGGLEVITPKGKVGDRDWTKRKARLLFAMLVSRFGTDVPRGEIIEYLWPEMDEERALNNFYVVWSAMKRAVSPASIRDTPSPFVEHVRGVCRVVKGRVVSDLDEFTELLAASRTARRNGDREGELSALRAIADLYRGEVLPGDVYDDWFAPLRDRFRHDFEDAMLRAAEILEEGGDPHGGLQSLRRAMVADPWREDLYQAQLRMQIAAGQRSAAIETYMHCRARLTEDLGIDPSRETTALYEQVLGMEE